MARGVIQPVKFKSWKVVQARSNCGTNGKKLTSTERVSSLLIDVAKACEVCLSVSILACVRDGLGNHRHVKRRFFVVLVKMDPS